MGAGNQGVPAQTVPSGDLGGGGGGEVGLEAAGYCAALGRGQQSSLTGLQHLRITCGDDTWGPLPREESPPRHTLGVPSQLLGSCPPRKPAASLGLPLLEAFSGPSWLHLRPNPGTALPSLARRAGRVSSRSAELAALLSNSQRTVLLPGTPLRLPSRHSFPPWSPLSPCGLTCVLSTFTLCWLSKNLSLIQVGASAWLRLCRPHSSGRPGSSLSFEHLRPSSCLDKNPVMTGVLHVAFVTLPPRCAT